jgi:hypothetical protein
MHVFSFVRIGIMNRNFRCTVAWIVAAIITLQSLIAADAWSRVMSLKVGVDMVNIALTSGEREKGIFMGADDAGITILANGSQNSTIARGLVLQVGIERIEKNISDAGSQFH